MLKKYYFSWRYTTSNFVSLSRTHPVLENWPLSCICQLRVFFVGCGGGVGVEGLPTDAVVPSISPAYTEFFVTFCLSLHNNSTSDPCFSFSFGRWDFTLSLSFFLLLCTLLSKTHIILLSFSSSSVVVVQLFSCTAVQGKLLCHLFLYSLSACDGNL